MRKVFLFFICIYFPTIVFGQFNAQVKSVSAQEPIPYVNVWVKDQYKGTSANQQGYFSLSVNAGDTLILSSVGFEKLEHVVQSLSTDTLELKMKEKAVVLDEVAVVSIQRKKSSAYTIDKINKWKTRDSWGTGGIPIIYGFVIEPEETFLAGMKIKSVSFVTMSTKIPSTVLVRLYEKGADGLPGNELHAKPILVHCKRGKNITTVDVENLTLQFPPEGLIVAIEFLCIEENTVEIIITDARGPGKPKKIKSKRVNPFIGISDDHQQNTLVYSNGSWSKISLSKITPRQDLRSIPFRLELRD